MKCVTLFIVTFQVWQLNPFGSNKIWRHCYSMDRDRGIRDRKAMLDYGVTCKYPKQKSPFQHVECLLLDLLLLDITGISIVTNYQTAGGILE